MFPFVRVSPLPLSCQEDKEDEEEEEEEERTFITEEDTNLTYINILK